MKALLMLEAGQKFLHVWLLFCLMLYTAAASGLDNPDAPDYVSDFLTQADTYEEKLMHGVYGTRDYVHAYAEYEHFLDQQLNQAYRLLMAHLDKNSQASFKQSQKKWLIYRDAEFDFIQLNWNKTNYGSSSAISQGAYRTTIIKNRVIALLHYLKNYPEN